MPRGRDITELRSAQLELADKNETLKQSNAGLEHIALIVSHDLREPLRMVSNYLELLKRRNSSFFDTTSMEFLKLAQDGAARMNGLISDLLDFSRIGSISPARVPTEMGALIKEAMQNLQPLIQECRAEIQVEALPTLAVDPSQAVQLFQNLLGNAMKYRKPGVSPHIKVSAENDKRGWIISVSDNGIGIDPKYHSRIFYMFQRLTDQAPVDGHGVGLAICQRIVEAQGGKIWVESKLGEGSTFRCLLPDSNPA